MVGAKKFAQKKNGGVHTAGGRTPFPPHSFVRLVPFKVIPDYKNKFFLHEMCVEKGLSLAQISRKIFSSKSAVLRGLKENGIPLREAHLPHGRTAQPRFGTK